MAHQFVAFIIGAAGGIDQPTASIKLLEPNLVLKTFDAKPDQEGIDPVCFWATGGTHLFYNNRTRFSSGLLPANSEALDWIQENGQSWRTEAELVEITSVQTQTLDGYCLANGLRPDFLSMDIQGAECPVLQGGQRALTTLLGIIAEVEFRQIYYHQALFADIDSLLRARGFQFMTLYVPQYWRLRPADTTKVLTVGEALFLRRPDGLDKASRDKLVAIAKCFGFERYAQSTTAS